MSKIAGVLWGAALAATLGCAGGTETDNPATALTAFTSSDCKGRQPDPGQQALLRASDAEGLQCVAWERTGRGALTVRLLNFGLPCADEYFGRASFDADGVALSVHKDRCEVLRCGNCLFDFDFELSGVSGEAPLRLRFGSAACESAPVTYTDELTLPLDEAPSGTVCRPVPRNDAEWHGRVTGACGSLNMPCGSCDSADASSCGESLTCAAIATGDLRCLAACETDEDCQLTTCIAGLCTPTSGF